MAAEEATSQNYTTHHSPEYPPPTKGQNESSSSTEPLIGNTKVKFQQRHGSRLLDQKIKGHNKNLVKRLSTDSIQSNTFEKPSEDLIGHQSGLSRNSEANESGGLPSLSNNRYSNLNGCNPVLKPHILTFNDQRSIFDTWQGSSPMQHSYLPYFTQSRGSLYWPGHTMSAFPMYHCTTTTNRFEALRRC